REDACRKCLQEDEFEEVLGDPELLGTYLKRTPSKRRIRRILEVYLEENTSPEIKEVILNYVKFNGLPSDLALECTKDGIYSSIAEPVQEALALYKEVEDVKQLFKSDLIPWKAWLGKRNNLSVEAQAEMSEWQLREYVAQGFVLYEDLLIEYMKDETKRNWILSYVRGLKEKGHLTEKAYILLTTEKWWRIKMI
ncbi:MAG: hypothetical protein IKL33_04270, partial [Alphaproteobacteria bacterium]|nr:hypothetical protein [Alphaproteobacteria bacterium]